MPVATAIIEKIMTAQIVDGPSLCYKAAIQAQGVYRLKNTPRSSAMVVIAEEQKYLVEETFSTKLELPPSDDCQFWPTTMQVPEEIARG